MVASEARRQRETLPRAAKRVSHRLVFYYLSAIFVLSLNVSSLDVILSTRLSTDPSRPYPGGFMVMLLRAGVPVLPHILNAVMIIASIGVANGEIFFTVSPTHCI
jgi:amino acid transporter